MMPARSRQTDISVEKNAAFFRDNISAYSNQVGVLDTYRNIQGFTNEALGGIDRLLDIGNGGTFDYDVTLIREIVAVDLFLQELPPQSFPRNVTPRNGSALAIPEPDKSFDGVLMSMLIHHLVGKSVEESLANVSQGISEAFRVLGRGGKLVIVESCVPRWFYSMERFVFPVATRLIGRFMNHPATLQFPPSLILDMLRRFSSDVKITPIPRGRWILQYGKKFPCALTPAAPYLFVLRK